MLPSTFTETVSLTQQFALEIFDRAIATQHLYYHNRWHIHTVQHRVDRLFAAVTGNGLTQSESDRGITDVVRAKRLLDLSVTAHDMVQIFLPHGERHTSRRRKSGVSEQATIRQLFNYIYSLNAQLAAVGRFQAQFLEGDLTILQAAIAGTICTYSSAEAAIYQPDLYDAKRDPGWVARILALADIGALGMDGIAAYNQEGSLLFLEENLDIIPFIETQTVEQLQVEQPDLAENFRQRLLNRARFQISLAQSRLVRTPQELAGLANNRALLTEVFPHLGAETLSRLKAMTPTDAASSLGQLLAFFELNHYVEMASDYLTGSSSICAQ